MGAGGGGEGGGDGGACARPCGVLTWDVGGMTGAICDDSLCLHSYLSVVVDSDVLRCFRRDAVSTGDVEGQKKKKKKERFFN